MYLCYIDESGTPDVPGNTSHFILAGISVPIWHWNDCDREIRQIKRRYDLVDSEIHTAWLLRQYLEQSQIPNFDSLSRSDRRTEVQRRRTAELLRLQSDRSRRRHYKQTKKNYRNTDDYVHLTRIERRQFIREIAQCVANWGFARLFAECVDKVHFDPSRTSRTIDEQAFEQVVTRFEHYLRAVTTDATRPAYGILIHDNNQTVATKHTEMMKRFHQHGTFWTRVNHIIETPLFVDSQLTGMVQIADLCSYSLRRYLENNETELFDLIFQRADRRGDVTVGIRHFTNQACSCAICDGHSST